MQPSIQQPIAIALPQRSSLSGSFVVILLVLACFALSPAARATCQEGCDTNYSNTFLGDNALISNTTGFHNTASGYQVLFNNTTGYYNTATGSDALFHNTTGYQNTATGS